MSERPPARQTSPNEQSFPATLRVSEIGEYIRHQSCQRRFKLEMNHRRLARRLPFVERLFNTLDPVLQAEGRKREEEWEASLQEAGLADLTVDWRPDDEGGPPTWSVFRAAVATVQPGQDAYGREVALSAQIGAFELQGRVDFLLLLWRGGRPVLRLVEGKASRRDRTYQRIQAGLYLLMVAHLLDAEPLVLNGRRLGRDDLEAVVARIDEATNESQEILQLEPLDLSMEEADITRLLAADGQLATIADTELDELGYQLDQKCDGCVFNVDCLPESARQRRHELLGVSAGTAAALRRAGLATLDDLADTDLASDAARAVRADPGFTESLEQLKVLAAVRRTTLRAEESTPTRTECSRCRTPRQASCPSMRSPVRGSSACTCVLTTTTPRTGSARSRHT
jgi:predicted RecB family nuclease